MIQEYKLEQFALGSRYVNFNITPIDKSQKERLSAPNRSSFYQIIIIRKGAGNYSVDFDNYELKPSSVCFVFPHQICIFDFSDEVEGDVIMFDETIFCSAILANELKEYNVDLQKKINFVDFSAIPLLFDELESVKGHIERFGDSLNSIGKMQIKFFTKIIIFKIIEASSSEEFSGVKSIDLETYIKFREYVDSEFMENRKVDNYCAKLGISAKKLNSLCKQYSSQNALDVIHNRLTLEIKKIFIFEDMSLKEIAYKLGFDSQSALNKYIASKFNSTPSELKEQLQKDYEL